MTRELNNNGDMKENLTLEKLQISNRLAKLEQSVESMDKTVREVSCVLFGEKGADGVVHQLREINTMISATKTVMGKIFFAILGLIAVSIFPHIINVLHEALSRG